MSERGAEVIGSAGEARTDHVTDAIAHGRIQSRPVPGDGLLVLGVPGRDEDQRGDAGEVEARDVVEVESPLPFSARSSAAQGGDVAVGRLLERERGELSVGAGQRTRPRAFRGTDGSSGAGSRSPS
ncbi:hypothetical protein ACIRF8_18725 [Streptomyces sp. NPDC102406]|uniref:hypothetical protein n=1 Tax=Streptomyces sp. NPDC102406 TaxID=3366171 RepID=UPI003810B7AB